MHGVLFCDNCTKARRDWKIAKTAIFFHAIWKPKRSQARERYIVAAAERAGSSAPPKALRICIGSWCSRFGMFKLKVFLLLVWELQLETALRQLELLTRSIHHRLIGVFFQIGCFGSRLLPV